MPSDVRSTLFQVMERTAAGRERPNKEKQMNKFTKVAVLALIASGLAMPAFAQSNANGANAGGAMSSSSSGSMSGSMSSGSMSGSMSDHAKTTTKKKKTGAMGNGSMSGSMSGSSMSNGSMSGDGGH